MESLSWIPILPRLLNAPVSYAAYIVQFFYPVRLAVIYPYPAHFLPIGKAVVAMLLLTTISVGVLLWWRRRPYLLVGWLWYLGMLVPVIGLVQVGSQAMADRYTYLPGIGLGIAVVWSVAEFARRGQYRRRWCEIAFGGAVLLLMACAWRQTGYWRDSETLWHRALECTAPNSVAHNGLAVALATKGTDARGHSPL